MSARSTEVEQLRSEVQRGLKAQEELRATDAELTAMYQQLCRLDPNGGHTYGPRSMAMEQQRQGAGRLVPMQQPIQQQVPTQATNGQGWPQASAMQGVEYSFDRR